MTPESKVICSDVCFATYRKKAGIAHYQEFAADDEEEDAVVEEDADDEIVGILAEDEIAVMAAVADTVDADDAKPSANRQPTKTEG